VRVQNGGEIHVVTVDGVPAAAFASAEDAAAFAVDAEGEASIVSLVIGEEAS